MSNAMVSSPVKDQSPELLNPPSDQDAAMDTDSEVENRSDGDHKANGNSEPDEVDSSINMEISDNEDPDDEPERIQLSPQAGLKIANDQAREINLLQANTNDTLHHLSDAILPSTNQTITLEDIRDGKEAVHGLNIPLWQRILTFISPLSLGKVMQTSCVFHALLDPRDIPELALHKRLTKESGYISPEAIWLLSRRRHASNVPKPLENKSELEMWRMLYGRKCQICNQRRTFINARDVSDPWHAGPGENGLRLLWLCANLICGRCLSQQCQQEISLQFSNTFPSFLIKALPPLFLTQHNDWISQSTLASGPPPSHLQIQKLFYQPHVDRILRKFEEVKGLGEAAAVEWLKGLESQCREQLDDANRWEQWERNGGLQELKTKLNQRAVVQTIAPSVQQAPTMNIGPTAPLIPANPPYVEHHIPMYHHHGPPPMPMMAPIPPMPFHGYPPPLPYGNFPQYPSSLNPQVIQGKPRRSLQEVNEARAARRQEIERRSLLIDPPITAKVLSHMQSFQAALQISFPFTDKDWDILEPRLLAQREAAEAQEAVLAEQLKVIQTTAAQPPIEVLLARNLHELSDSEWEQVQAPVRDILSQHAEQYINENWEGGSRVDHENVTLFAPGVLLGVRNKYYEALNQPIQPNGSQNPRIPLSLENMKWLYDNKVKNTAEAYQKELFQCSACDSGSRFYGFEGVIQHFAAKHTTALSLGNIIVNWRVDWPELSPFNSAPGSTTNGWKTPFPGSVRTPPNATSNDYSSAIQPGLYSHHSGLGEISQHPHGFGQFQQAPTFYGQSGHDNYGSIPAGFPVVSQAFPLHRPYGLNSAVEQGYQNPQMQYGTSSATSDLHRKQLTDMAIYSRDLWNATMGIKELPASVRVHVLIHHMSIKFIKKFSTSPDVAMFLHGLNENAQMRPTRSLNGLLCKICKHNEQNSALERKSFTLPALVNHFKNTHLTSAEDDELDWRIDMVDLPENEVVESLVDSNGMDDRKFNLIAEAFQDVFPSPLPTLSALKEGRAKAKSAALRLENLRALSFPLAGGAGQSQQSAVTDPHSRVETRRTSQEKLPSRSPPQSDGGSIEPPREDEYDPSRNTFIGDIVEHSGFRRSSNLQKPPDVVLPPGIVSLGVIDDNVPPESPYSQGGYADRLLRHHRGQVRRHTGDVQEYLKQDKEMYVESPNGVAARTFPNGLVSTLTPQDNNVAYGSNLYSPTEDVDARGSEQSTFVSPQAIRYAYSPPHYNEIQPEYNHTIAHLDPRVVAQLQARPPQLYESLPPERRRQPVVEQSVHIQGHCYSSRDRSRSPRRSLPREHNEYDPHVPQVSYEGREVRWRGDSPSRHNYYRGQQEATQAARAGESFIGRDAQGRNVRYVAVPMEEYEPQSSRYPMARPPVVEQMSYLTTSDDLMEVGPDGRLYLTDGRGSVRYERNPVDGMYRDYR